MDTGSKNIPAAARIAALAAKLNTDTHALGAFNQRFQEAFESCPWTPHPSYSVFTQYDKEHYLPLAAEFMRKYRCFWSVSKALQPQSIVELGTASGSSADAYISASPTATYVGIDGFPTMKRTDTGEPFDFLSITTELFRSRGFLKYHLIPINLRSLCSLAGIGRMQVGAVDLVVVDAAHDFDNQYQDLRLAQTLKPKYIFIDDAADENQALPAIEKFLSEDVPSQIVFTSFIPYLGGGMVVKLQH